MNDFIPIYLGKPWGYNDNSINGGNPGANGFVDPMVVERFTFPDGTPHVKIKEEYIERERPMRVMIMARPVGMMGFVEILLLNDALERMGVNDINLCLPYVHGSRQDRVCVPGEPHSAGVFAEMLNSCLFSAVYVWDPHSDVISGMINNCVIMPGIGGTIAHHFKLRTQENLTLIAPDVGAAKKVWEIALKLTVPMVQCGKHRDLETGKISGFTVGDGIIEGRNLLIVDDICTNGGTFIGLMKELRKQKPKTINLCITHADHAAGLIMMANIFDQVWVSDSRGYNEFDLDNVNILGLCAPIN